MTKRFFMLLAVAMAAVVVHAEDFTANGIKYTGNESTMTATVTGTEDGFNQTDVVIPETVNGYTVTKIGDNAFFRKQKLISVIMPNSVTSIGYMSFGTCRNLETVVFSENIETIGENAFGSCQRLKEIKLTNTVTSIGAGAFQGTGISSFVFPERITEISESLLCACDSLKAVILPPSLKKIGKLAFIYSGLESINIPATVTEIEFDPLTKEWPFTSNMKNIIVAEGNPVYDSRNNCNAIIETATNTLIIGGPNTIIPSNVTSIGLKAFHWTSFESIVIPSSVRTIGEQAFEGSMLKHIDIPNSVTSIGESAFSVCESLASVKLPESLTALEFGVFYGCRSLPTISLPSSLQRIEDWVFNHCFSMESIIIPTNVTKIGTQAFGRCYKLQSITIPASVTEIVENPFMACRALSSINVDKENKVYDSREGCNAIIKTSTNELVSGCQTTVIPSSTASIGMYAFEGCTGLTAITIPAGVTSIGFHAFENCDQLKTFTSLIEEPFETSLSFGIHDSGDNGKTLYVPKGCTNKYKATEGWNWFQYIREIGDTSEGYLWTGDYERGGKAEATDSVSVGYENAGYTTLRLNGKPKWYEGDYINVSLEKPLHTGDKISITAYRNKNAANKKSGVRMELSGEGISGTVTLASSTGLEFVNIDQSDASASDSNRGTEPNTCIFEVPAKADGCTYFYMTRSHAETNLFITKIEIGKAGVTAIRPVHTTSAATDCTWYTLDGRRVKRPATKGIYINNGRKVVMK